jgi:hypothetical protein
LETKPIAERATNVPNQSAARIAAGPLTALRTRLKASIALDRLIGRPTCQRRMAAEPTKGLPANPLAIAEDSIGAKNGVVIE